MEHHDRSAGGPVGPEQLGELGPVGAVGQDLRPGRRHVTGPARPRRGAGSHGSDTPEQPECTQDPAPREAGTDVSGHRAVGPASPAGTKCATHSTWWVIGKASKARRPASAVPPLAQGRGVPRQRCRVARHVRDGAGPQGGHRPDDGRAGPGPRRVEDDHVRTLRDEGRAHGSTAAAAAPVGPGQPERVVDPRPDDHDVPDGGEGRGGPLDRGPVGLHRHDLALRADRLRERGREQADPRVEVEGALPRPHVERAHDRLEEGRRRTGVHLPEAPRGDRVVVRVRHDTLAPGPGGLDVLDHVGHLTARDDHGHGVPDRRRDDVDGLGPRPVTCRRPDPGHRRRRDPAAVDRHDLVRPVPAKPRPAVGTHRELDPGPPAQPVGVARHRLHLDVDLETGEPGQLLADHPGLEPALGSEPDVLEVAATARPGAAPRARRHDPVRRRLEHLERVGPDEPGPRPDLGDPGEDALPRQGVPHEEHLPVVPGHTVPTVGERGDLDRDLVADGEPGSRGRRHRSPRRTSPTTGPSIRSSMPSDDASCQGTEETMTPGVKSSRVRSRRALWLCSSCSHQWPTTYCGM